MLKLIITELRHHIPFTIFGTLTGLVLLGLGRNLPSHISYKLFYTLHPVHVVFSAMATASMYGLYKCGCFKGKCNLWQLIPVSIVGALGIATLSDSLIPFIGEKLLNMPHAHVHIGFIEEPWLVLPMAFFGIGLAYFRPSTQFPHFGHVLLSTWASLFHILMASGETISSATYVTMAVFLFLAVWLPCCISDIVFPLLFVKPEEFDEHRTCH